MGGGRKKQVKYRGAGRGGWEMNATNGSFETAGMRVRWRVWACGLGGLQDWCPWVRTHRSCCSCQGRDAPAQRMLRRGTAESPKRTLMLLCLCCSRGGHAIEFSFGTVASGMRLRLSDLNSARSHSKSCSEIRESQTAAQAGGLQRETLEDVGARGEKHVATCVLLT